MSFDFDLDAFNREDFFNKLVNIGDIGDNSDNSGGSDNNRSDNQNQNQNDSICKNSNNKEDYFEDNVLLKYYEMSKNVQQNAIPNFFNKKKKSEKRMANRAPLQTTPDQTITQPVQTAPSAPLNASQSDTKESTPVPQQQGEEKENVLTPNEFDKLSMNDKKENIRQSMIYGWFNKPALGSYKRRFKKGLASANEADLNTLYREAFMAMDDGTNDQMFDAYVRELSNTDYPASDAKFRNLDAQLKAKIIEKAFYEHLFDEVDSQVIRERIESVIDDMDKLTDMELYELYSAVSPIIKRRREQAKMQTPTKKFGTMSDVVATTPAQSSTVGTVFNTPSPNK